MSAFKSYDIRGIYPTELNEERAYRIGYFLKDLFGADKILVGRDIRLSSEALFQALAKGICDSGAMVYDAGLCTTPMIYFGSFSNDFLTSVMITASHNPKEYNGFKISGPKAAPMGEDSGLKILEEKVLHGVIEISPKKGDVISFDLKDKYLPFMKNKLLDISGLKISVDCSGGMASLLAKETLGTDGVSYLFDSFDGSFSAHSPNPLEPDSREALRRDVLEKKSDIGIIFDGDADRAMFIDNKGRFVSPDLIIAVLANVLVDEAGQKVVMDIRSSKAVSQYIKSIGGDPVIWKVGHVYAKAKIKQLDAVFGGELAGHYYFREFGCCDSAFLAAIYLLNALAEWKKDNIYLSDVIDELSVYAFSGELNFKVENKDAVIKRVTDSFKKQGGYQKFYDFDGIRFDFDDWWFNIRKSNTEPYLRLVAEADNQTLLEEKLKILKEKMGVDV